MNTKIISFLQKVFWVIGLAILLLAIMNLVSEAYFQLNYADDPYYQITSMNGDFNFFVQAELFFAAIGHAFFSFLVSAVFQIVFRRGPVNLAYNERILKICCFGYLGQATFGILIWIRSAPYFFGVTESSSFLGLVVAIGNISTIIPSVVVIIYAISIYVLYRHFTATVTIESEVV